MINATLGYLRALHSTPLPPLLMITVNASSLPMRHSAVALSPWALDFDTVSFQGSQRAKSSPSPSQSLHTGGLSTDTVMTNHCCFQRSVLGYSS